MGDIAKVLHNIELLVCTVCTVHCTWSKVKAISAAAYVADSGSDISAQTEVGVQPSTQTVAVLRNSDLHTRTTVLNIVVYNVGGTLKKYEHFIKDTNFNLKCAENGVCSF